MANYPDVSETDLISMAKSGDNKAFDDLFWKYHFFIRSFTRGIFFPGKDKSDVAQEAHIGFWKAIKSFNPKHNVSFAVFAKMCIRRHLITSIIESSREKHKNHNTARSLNEPIYSDNQQIVWIDRQASVDLSAEERVVLSETVKETMVLMKETLTKLEMRSIYLYYQGYAYEEIAETLNKDIKSIDNALQRVKRKMRPHKNTLGLG